MEANGRLKVCMDSLVNQSITDYEIIAVNDGSTDGSLALLREYEQKYIEKVTVIDLPENIKQGGAKNRALDVCSGEYIGFVDSDDCVSADMFKKMLNRALETEADIVACDLSKTYSHEFEIGEVVSGINKDAVGVMNDDHFRKFILDTGHMVIKIYRRSIFMEPRLRFPERMFYEDNAIALETIHRAKRIEYVDEPLYCYFQSSTSTVHTVTKERCENRMEAMRIMLRLARDGGYYENFKTEIEYKFINLFYQNTLFSYMQASNHKSISFIRKLGQELKETFPDFEDNALYRVKTSDEERKLMHMQQKSTLIFICYYKLLWTYRHIRYGK